MSSKMIIISLMHCKLDIQIYLASYSILDYSHFTQLQLNHYYKTSTQIMILFILAIINKQCFTLAISNDIS